MRGNTLTVPAGGGGGGGGGGGTMNTFSPPREHASLATREFGFESTRQQWTRPAGPPRAGGGRAPHSGYVAPPAAAGGAGYPRTRDITLDAAAAGGSGVARGREFGFSEARAKFI